MLIAQVIVNCPSAMTFDYLIPSHKSILPGQLVSVSLGKRKYAGIVHSISEKSSIPMDRLKPVNSICKFCSPLREEWLALINFASKYYHRSIGEVALSSIPSGLRDLKSWNKKERMQLQYVMTEKGKIALSKLSSRAKVQRRLAESLLHTPLSFNELSKLHGRATTKFLKGWESAGWLNIKVCNTSNEEESATVDTDAKTSIGENSKLYDMQFPVLSEEQNRAIREINKSIGYKPFLLHGITGSGKTEVYLQVVDFCLKRDRFAQVLLLIPEINLMSQFISQVRTRFTKMGMHAIATLHSRLSESQRTANWLAIHQGDARIVIGTRLAIFASFRKLSLLIIDEEHEDAYKQQTKLQYSARDLSIWRAKYLGVTVILGSATPSLETWYQAKKGRYHRLILNQRVRTTTAKLPIIKTIDLNIQKRQGQLSEDGLSSVLLEAMNERLSRGEQSLLFLNRRGYAPVLSCEACSWISGCSHCSAYLVLHRGDGVLRCHHCSWKEVIPSACPSCGNIDLRSLGYGTQRIELALAKFIPDARVLRIDADSAHHIGSTEILFKKVHAGHVDILIGTNMIAKGHDFQKVTLVGVINADSSLFSHNFRASEKLFSQLTQVAGRAGRSNLSGEVLIQTYYPRHPLYVSLALNDYSRYADLLLEERRVAHLPPFTHQALLKAEACALDQAVSFLENAALKLDTMEVVITGRVIRYLPIPLILEKTNDIYRAQLLLESRSRRDLHIALCTWKKLRRGKGILRWGIQVDPLEI